MLLRARLPADLAPFYPTEHGSDEHCKPLRESLFVLFWNDTDELIVRLQSASRIALPVSRSSTPRVDLACLTSFSDFRPQNFDGEELTSLIKKLIMIDSAWIPSEPGHSLYIRASCKLPRRRVEASR